MHPVTMSWQIILLDLHKRACGSSDTSLIIRRGRRTYRFLPYSEWGMLRRVYALGIYSGTLSAPRKVGKGKESTPPSRLVAVQSHIHTFQLSHNSMPAKQINSCCGMRLQQDERVVRTRETEHSFRKTYALLYRVTARLEVYVDMFALRLRRPEPKPRLACRRRYRKPEAIP